MLTVLIETEGHPSVFPRMSPCAHPPDQPQFWSYWDMQGQGARGAAGVESQTPGAQLGNDFKPITLRPPLQQPKLQAHSACSERRLYMGPLAWSEGENLHAR